MTKKGDPQKEVITGAEGAPEAAEDLAKASKEAAAEERASTRGASDQPEPPRDDDTKVADVPDEATEAEGRDSTRIAEAPDVEEEKPKRRRRGAAETTTAAAPKPAPARRTADGTVVVRAQAKYVRTAPRKARLVVDHIRGKTVEEARAILRHTPRAASTDVLKVLNSAVANAENNHELFADELKVHQAYVDEGPTIKRFRPRAQGRATRIRKRTSHLTITLTPKE